MQLSASNQVKGTVSSIESGTVMARVIVDIGGQQLVAAITQSSIDKLGLAQGSAVTAIIKATEVMLATE